MSVQGLREGLSEQVTRNTHVNTKREESGNSIPARENSKCKGHLTGGWDSASHRSGGCGRGMWLEEVQLSTSQRK